MAAEIESSGPIPFARYMDMALYEPGLGYYVNGLHKFGAAGDFITAPEQGGLFAEGLACQLDAAVSGYRDWTLMEIGPGSGALAAALLPRLRVPPERCLLLETSAVLRRVQAEHLESLPAGLQARVAWVDAPPDEPFRGAIVANEVIDALPVERFRVAAGGIEQLLVDRDRDGFANAWCPASGRLAEAVEQVLRTLDEPLAEGYESEILPHLSGWLDTVTRPLAEGLALLVDYGYPRREYYHPQRGGGTLVCHYRHRAHFDPFIWPGLTDISAFVDFTALAGAADECGLDVAGFTTQAGFLLGMGVQDLIGRQTDQITRVRLAAEFKRLVLPGEMGEKFKIMALTRNFELPGEGFALADRLGRL